MNGIETRLRTALERRAGVPAPRPMPEGTARRVRARQLGTGAGIVAIAVVAVLVGALVLVSLPRGSGSKPADDGYPSPLEDVPPGWPLVQISDPATAYLPPVEDAENVTDGPMVLASGTVDGSAFTLYAYTLGRKDAATECLGFVGFAAAGAPASTAPDVVMCSNAPAVPEAQDVAFAGAGSSERQDLEANFGFVSERVDKILVWSGGDLRGIDIPTLEPLPGWDVRPIFFVPSADAGPLEVRAKIDAYTFVTLAHGDICLPVSTSGTCRTEVLQDLPIDSPVEPPDPPEAGAWPEVTAGGAFEPYVDHEANADGVVDPGVVGPKTVVAYGTVEGVPWSLVGYNTRDVDAPDGLSPSGQLFLGAQGGYGGGGLGLYNTMPWQPNDLGLTQIAFGATGLVGTAGVVSERVAALELRSDDGDVRSIELIPGPGGVAASYFVLWAPSDLVGTVVALGPDGSVVQQADLCLPGAGLGAGSNAAC